MNNKAANSSGSKRKNAIRIKKDLEKMNALLESKEGPFGKGEICFSITGEVEKLSDIVFRQSKKGSRQYDVAHAFIQGEEGTPYEGGLFEMKVLIPEDYPLRSPICQFQIAWYICKTKLFHPKTNLRGDCSHFGQPNDHCETWKASITIPDVLLAIHDSLNHPEKNPDHHLWTECYKIFKENREKFNKTAKDWTQKFAK
eukprot:jgi/Bigna1/75331/fgenesh1_pg.34_\